MQTEQTTKDRLIFVQREIANLRRGMRFQQTVFVFLLVTLVGLFGLGAVEHKPKIVRANRFEVTDRDGNVVARLGHYHRGSGSLEILTREGKVVIEASALKGNGLFKVFKENGEIILTSERSGT